MNFRNKPHLERIDEAKARIDDGMATINQMLTFRKRSLNEKEHSQHHVSALLYFIRQFVV
ncbi:Uncharacterised protein [Weissella viridescens]|uniref:Uncharacterized protein n=1 Tax=Weissella viridescens TaxID=1629 RepID=A0A380P3A0_WEIVI|nr:Uncharacterised protein [Weissella viridescens]